MGSEDLFHKRKAKKQQDSVRRIANRKPYDHVLIVCEGEKTVKWTPLSRQIMP